MSNPDIPDKHIPDKSENISKVRSGIKEIEKRDAPGESPEELRILCESKVRRAHAPAHKVWVMLDHCCYLGETIIPFSTDHMISCLADFISKGSALNRDSRMVLRITGDATHDKSKQRLKKMVLGVGGTHFVKGQWRNTIIPIMYVVCAQESTKCLELGLAALDAVLESRFGFKLNDVVAEWYWDGRPEAMTVLAKHFEGKPGHLCLQHAKKQIGARFGKGFSHEVKKGIDLMALMPQVD